MSAARGHGANVLLLSLPWTTITEPSLGLGLLKAVLDRHGIAARVWHLNLELLRFVRPETYYALSNVFALNDFLFSGVLDPVVSPHQLRILHDKARQLLRFGTIARHERGGVDGVVADLLRFRNDTVPAWLAEVAAKIGGGDSSLVGFTCMFDQTVASLALAKLVREQAPDKMIVFGGYAVRPPTAQALLRSFPWVDAICTGDGEGVIVELARASVEGGLGGVPGILHRDGINRPVATPAVPPTRMDEVPPPNFDDFFRDTGALAAAHQIYIDVDRLPVENSRGCWWGAKHHCIFCGIHDDDLRYRAKSAAVVLEDLAALSARYGVRAFRFSDYILPDGYYRSLLPELAARGKPYRLTSEMKANVSAQKFSALAAAGFEEVQPGIESFATSVLRKMDKGVTALQNVHTLLLGCRHGIRVHYNLLYGFPDDGEEEYTEMIRLLRLLRHLDAPSTRLEVQITRFAPLQVDPTRFGIAASQHEQSYELIFSQDYLDCISFDLDDLCYYYNRPFENSYRLN